MKQYRLLIERFWSGQATETEKLQLYKLLLEEEASVKLVLQETWEDGQGDALPQDRASQLLASLHREIGQRSLTAARPLAGRNKIVWFRWAAAFLLLGLTALFYWSQHTQPVPVMADALATTARVLENTGGQIQHIPMADGSEVRLYPGARLHYQEPFDRQSERRMVLEGKAGFTVHHDAEKPFIVEAKGILTIDIGTIFCIDARSTHDVTIDLKEGSVQVRSKPDASIQIQERVLKPGDHLQVNLKTGMVALQSNGNHPRSTPVVKSVPAAASSPKGSRGLHFSREPLPAVFAALEKRDGVKIRYEASDKTLLTFTGTIEPEDSLTTALNIICNLNGLHYRHVQDTYVIETAP